MLFVPVSVDAFILPRAGLALAAAGALAGAGLVAGRRSLGPLRLPALAVALAALAAAAASIAPGLSLVGAYGRYESLPMRLAYLGLFCGAAWLGERELVVNGFLLGCGAAAAEAIYQAATGAGGRPDGNLGQPNLLGALLAMAIPLALVRARAARAPAAFGPPAWLGLAGLLAIGLAVSASRSGWLGALAGTAVAAVFGAPARLLRPAAAAAALAIAAAAAVILLSPLRGLNQDTGTARLGVWRDSLSLVARRPLLGWGEDTTGLVLGRYQTADWEPGHNFDRAHSMPLDLAATQGLAGLAACGWLFATWWRRVWRRPELAGLAGAAAAYLAWSLLNFDWAPATAALWLLAGAAWPGEAAAPPAGRRLRLTAAAALVAAGLALAAPALAADVAYFEGRPALAAALGPLQPRYRAATGTLAGLRAAARLDDPEPAAYVALGDAEARAGDGAAARAAYRRALALYPYEADARSRLLAAAGTAPPAPASGSRRAASG